MTNHFPSSLNFNWKVYLGKLKICQRLQHIQHKRTRVIFDGLLYPYFFLSLKMTMKLRKPQLKPRSQDVWTNNLFLMSQFSFSFTWTIKKHQRWCADRNEDPFDKKSYKFHHNEIDCSMSGNFIEFFAIWLVARHLLTSLTLYLAKPLRGSKTESNFFLVCFLLLSFLFRVRQWPIFSLFLYYLLKVLFVVFSL